MRTLRIISTCVFMNNADVILFRGKPESYAVIFDVPCVGEERGAIKRYRVLTHELFRHARLRPETPEELVPSVRPKVLIELTLDSSSF